MSIEAVEFVRENPESTLAALAEWKGRAESAEATLVRVKAELDEHPGTAHDSAIKLVARIWRAINAEVSE